MSNENELKTDEKTCPYCGEFIKKSASKCKHCQSELNGNEHANRVDHVFVKSYGYLKENILNIKFAILTLVIIASVLIFKFSNLNGGISFIPQYFTGGDYSGLIEKALQNLSIKKRNNGCYFTKSEVGVCYKISNVIQTEIGGIEYIFVNMNGVNASASHSELGLTRLYKFKIENKDEDYWLKIISKSEAIQGGYGFGQAPDVKTVRINDEGEIAWIVENGFMNQGQGGSSLSVFVAAEGQIKEIAVFPITSFNLNENTNVFAAVKTKRDGDGLKYYSISAKVDGKTFNFRYDEKNKSYLIPVEYSDLF